MASHRDRFLDAMLIVGYKREESVNVPTVEEVGQENYGIFDNLCENHKSFPAR